MKLIIYIKFHFYRRNCIESRRGGGVRLPPPSSNVGVTIFTSRLLRLILITADTGTERVTVILFFMFYLPFVFFFYLAFLFLLELLLVWDRVSISCIFAIKTLFFFHEDHKRLLFETAPTVHEGRIALALGFL